MEERTPVYYALKQKLMKAYSDWQDVNVDEKIRKEAIKQISAFLKNKK